MSARTTTLFKFLFFRSRGGCYLAQKQITMKQHTINQLIKKDKKNQKNRLPKKIKALRKFLKVFTNTRLERICLLSHLFDVDNNGEDGLSHYAPFSSMDLEFLNTIKNTRDRELKQLNS